MSDTASILSPARIQARIDAHSRKRALEIASVFIADDVDEFSDRMLFDALMARERLGSTCIGNGVAIPHCRMACSRIFGAFMTLDEAVDFEADDDELVDMLFILVVPENENEAHLNILSVLARLFMEANNRQQLRECQTDASLSKELLFQLNELPD